MNNNNTLNFNSINGDDPKQNLPLKAYFLNKYEHSTTNSGEDSLIGKTSHASYLQAKCLSYKMASFFLFRIDRILSDSTTEPGHASKLYKNLQSVSRTPQPQKNTNATLNESTASMYVAKPNMPSLHNNGFTSDSINKMNLASKLHFSGSQSSLINSGM